MRTALHDLAGGEDGFADPLPAATGSTAGPTATGSTAGTRDPGRLDPTPVRIGPQLARPPMRRRRLLPGLAIAATLLGVLALGGFGIAVVVRGGGNGSSGSNIVSAPERAAGTAADAGTSPGVAAGACSTTVATKSTGPLAGNASVRPSGFVGPSTKVGGSAAVTYQLGFAAAGGTVQLRAAQVLQLVAGQVCGRVGAAQSNAIQVVDVEPGAGISGSATFEAVGPDGSPLPAGEYQVVVVIGYKSGDVTGDLVSPPVTVTVS